MQRLNQLIIYTSRHAWLFLLAVLVGFGSLFGIFPILQDRFAGLTGGQLMFDFQNRLSTEQIAAQLPAYDAAAKQVYYVFSVVDFLFPFFASLFLAAMAAFSLRYLAPAAYEWITERRLWPLFMIPAACDWLENVFALTVVSAAPDPMPTAAALLVGAKLAKLSTMVIAQALGWTLLALAALKWLAVRVGIMKPAGGEG